MNELTPLQEYFTDEFVDPIKGYIERDTKWFYRYILPHLKQDIQNVSDKKMLDVGCGFGYFTNIISKELNINIDGVDFIEKRIVTARDNYKGINFYQADLTSKTLSTELKDRYDYLFTNAVIPHIPIDDKIQVFTNLAKISNPGAILYMYDNLISTSVNGGFVGLLSLPWIEENVKEWQIINSISVCRETFKTTLRLL